MFGLKKKKNDIDTNYVSIGGTFKQTSIVTLIEINLYFHGVTLKRKIRQIT